jgi:hypothetical protein
VIRCPRRYFPPLFVQLKGAFPNQPAGARIDVSDADGQLLIKSAIAEAVAGVPGALNDR